MTDSGAPCCPHLKQIQATIVRYNPNRSKERESTTNNDSNPIENCLQAAQETEEFQDRVSKLKCKLEEANANIALLRTWVGETGEEIKDAKPKGPKQIVEEIKELIANLDDFGRKIDELTDAGGQAMKMLDEVENQSCYCALNTESCEEIKGELAKIAEAKESLEETINEMQNAKEEGPLPPDEMIDAIKEEIANVRECTDWTCPKLNEGSKGATPPSFMETGIQSNCCAPCKRPKLSQTDANPKWNQGTSPCCAPTCSK